MRVAGQNGTLKLRDNVVHIGVVITARIPFLRHIDRSITENKPAKKTADAADRLHETEIYNQIYAIGIGRRDSLRDILKFIADPESLQFPVAGFDDDLFM